MNDKNRKRFALSQEPIAVEAFWARVHKTRLCWLYGGDFYDVASYGLFNFAGINVVPMRFSYMAATGLEIPAKAHICHKCDIPNCVNPDHLFIGKGGDNVFDRNIKLGKSVDLEVSHLAALFEPFSTSWLADKLGRGVSTVSRWRNGRSLPPKTSLIHIASVLNVPEFEVFEAYVEDCLSIYESTKHRELIAVRERINGAASV